MDKCPYCGAETRPGDNFCLNCGNRLLSATPSSSPQQAVPGVGDATLPAVDEWAAPASAGVRVGGWADETVASTSAGSPHDQPTYRADASAPTVQATLDRIEQPARFVLRADNGEILQEYPLDKPEISIGRAPNSDILLSKDKLTSRRHATVRYENGQYLLRDERSANGTFVNGQQIEEVTPRLLQDGDHIGIGEHELIFRAFGSPSVSQVEDLPTVAVPLDSAGEMTYRTRDDDMATVATDDDYGTRTMDEAETAAPEPEKPEASLPAEPPVAAPATNGSAASSVPAETPHIPLATSYAQPATTSTPAPASSPAASKTSAAPSNPSVPLSGDEEVNFQQITSLPLPALPDLTALMAAMSTLDGQLMSLQAQFDSTRQAMQGHEAGIAQVVNQLRGGIRRVSDRMDTTIADVARSREALAWAELLQLMEDVMNNPRDIEYVTKLARKARELNKVFQLHQNVLNTMAECNSLLRSMIGEEK